MAAAASRVTTFNYGGPDLFDRESSQIACIWKGVTENSSTNTHIQKIYVLIDRLSVSTASFNPPRQADPKKEYRLPFIYNEGAIRLAFGEVRAQGNPNGWVQLKTTDSKGSTTTQTVEMPITDRLTEVKMGKVYALVLCSSDSLTVTASIEETTRERLASCDTSKMAGASSR